MRKMALLAAVALLIAGTPAVPVHAENVGVETTSTVLAATDAETQVQSFVERMYQVSLDRGSDPVGLEDWTNRLLTHEVDGAGIARGFILSAEFTDKDLSNEAYVDALYNAFFGREADAEGRQTWLNALASGQSKTYVLAGFVNSGEFDNLCESFGIARGILFESGEAANPGIRLFVERLYTKTLGRQGEKVGIDDWTGRIVWGEATPEEAAKGFVASDEFQNLNLSDEDYVERLYETFMDRASDTAGKADWLSRLSNGATREEVLEGISRSEEFGNILVEFGLTEGTGQEPEPTEAPVVTPAPTEESTEEPTAAPTAAPEDTLEPTETPNPNITFTPWTEAGLEDHVMDWQDWNLEAAMREITGITDRDIMLSDVWEITSLKLNWKNIGDISSLSGLTNLTHLSFYGNRISDISSLSGLTNLTYLFLAVNYISDISSLSGLTNLTDLTLGDNYISDISSLSGLTNLTHLNFYNNRISDISSLSGLTNLTTLSMIANEISDISSLSGLTNLTTLYLTANEISDINSLSGLTNLTELSIFGNPISDISSLSGLTNLTDLSLGENEISDISSLSGLTNLTTLYLEGNEISDFSPLDNLTNCYIIY